MNIILPLIVLFIVFYGYLKKVPLYDTFIEGSKESFKMILNMFPPILAMIFGVNIFIKSGILNAFYSLLSFIKIPMEILPMIIMRPISGTGSLAILENIYEQFGPDSLLGIWGSIIQGSTDTTFYVLTLYFGSVGIKKIRYAAWAGLLTDLVGIIVSLIIMKML